MFDKQLLSPRIKSCRLVIEPIETSSIEGFLMEHKTEFPMIYKGIRKL